MRASNGKILQFCKPRVHFCFLKCIFNNSHQLEPSRHLLLQSPLSPDVTLRVSEHLNRAAGARGSVRQLRRIKCLLMSAVCQQPRSPGHRAEAAGMRPGMSLFPLHLLTWLLGVSAVHAGSSLRLFSGAHGLSSCSTQTQQLWLTGLAAPRHEGS